MIAVAVTDVFRELRPVLDVAFTVMTVTLIVCLFAARDHLRTTEPGSPST